MAVASDQRYTNPYRLHASFDMPLSRKYRYSTNGPRGAITFRDIVGKLDVLNIEWDKCGVRLNNVRPYLPGQIICFG